MKPRRTHMIWSVLSFLLMGAAWLLFAPAPVGGQASYAIVDGNSMEPMMHQGDLAVLRATDEYAVGDVVTYRDPDIGLIMHRIVSRNGERFTLQGDNNDWLDVYHPTPSEIMGELWFSVPHLGKLLGLFSQPPRLAVLSALLGGIVIMGAIVKKEPSPEVAAHVASSPEQGKELKPASGETLDWLLLFGLITVLAVVLGIMSFGQPLQQPAMVEMPYEHTGQFNYQAAARGTVYDTSAAHTGDPVFFQVSDHLAILFEYDLAAEAEHSVSGTYRLVAELGERNGWRRTFELVPETPFADQFRTEAVLDLAMVQNAVVGYQTETGVQRRDYTLTLRPEIAIQGTLAHEELSDQFAPELTFALDETQLWLPPEGEGDADPTRPVTARFVTTEGLEDTSLSLLGFSLPVSTGRWLSLAGGVIGLLGLLMVGRSLFAGHGAGTTADDAPAQPSPPQTEVVKAPVQPPISYEANQSPPPARPSHLDRLSRRAEGADLDKLAMLSVPVMTGAMMVMVLVGLLALIVLDVPIVEAGTGNSPAAPASSAAGLAGYVSFSAGGSRMTSSAPSMIDIPGGTFPMGSDDYEVESPVHMVEVAPYAIDTYEVTNRQWSGCVEAGICPPLPGEVDDEAASKPVVGVTWSEAAAYCEWRDARLPTEAEWEMAARWDPETDSVSVYPWGDTWSPDRLNYCDEGCAADDPSHVTFGYTDGWPQLAPAGTWPAGASALGVMDMAGNAAEWVQDPYGRYTASPQAGMVEQRVVRGGAWNLEPAWARTTARLGVPPDVRAPGIGFRCAADATASTTEGM